MNGFLQLLLSLHLQIPGPTRVQWQMQADQTAHPLFWGCSRSLCNSGRKQECKQDQHEAGQASLRQWPATAQLTTVVKTLPAPLSIAETTLAYDHTAAWQQSASY